LPRRPGVDELEGDLQEASLGSTLAVILVAAAVLSLALLPPAIALRVPVLWVDWLAAGLSGLGAAVVGVKLVVMAWAVGTRLWSPNPAGLVPTYAD
jgi:hypothetical protein